MEETKQEQQQPQQPVEQKQNMARVIVKATGMVVNPPPKPEEESK